jgi:hypothetical protein
MNTTCVGYDGVGYDGVCFILFFYGIQRRQRAKAFHPVQSHP